MANLFGTLVADSLTGTSVNDVISGAPLGNETEDTGSDTLLGGSDGADTIYGWGGDDSIVGSNGAEDSLFGGAGNDTIQATENSDAFGEAGDDRIVASGSGGLFGRGGSGRDTVFGDTGDDIINDDDVANTDADSLSGGGGRDRIENYGGADTLDGGTGDDQLTSFGSADRIDGGDGFDLATIDRSTLTVGFKLKLGLPTAVSTSNDGMVVIGLEQVVVRGGSGRDNIRANAGNDSLSGNEGNDILNGGKGNDQIGGGDGADTIIGSSGADGLAGGAKADAFRWTALDRGNFDTVYDFGDGPDRLEFSTGALGDLLAAGTLSAASFALDTATAAAPQFIYLTATDTLVWDANGTGNGRAITIANFLGDPTLTAADIVIIA